jgi:nicotinamide-nucleotide amidase
VTDDVPAVGPGGDGDDLVALAAAVRAACVARGLTVATAESCTGGLVSHLLTEVPGASACLLGGVVAYADHVKVALLGVDPGLIAAEGAVSEGVAVAMARGARERVGADLGVGVTGIAGPDGGSEAKPVGLAFIAVSGPAGTTVRRCLWAGDRSANKVASARTALTMLLAAAGATTGTAAERPPAYP